MPRFALLLICALIPATRADNPTSRMDETGARASVVLEQHAPPAAGPVSPETRGPTWTPLGPPGGDVQDVAVSPTDANLMLAGTAPGGSFGGALYRSTDGGLHWSKVPQLSNNSIFDIEFSPDGSIYAGTINGVWKSTNAGANWSQLALGIGINQQIFDVTIDPVNPNVIWAGVGDAGGGQPILVIRSTTAGTSWSNVTPPLGAPISCKAIAIDPGNSNNVYACFGGGFGGGQVWVTANGGATTPTWTNRSLGLPNNPMNAIVHDGARVLVAGGQLFGSQNVGLYASTNQGQNWTPVHDGTWPSRAINDVRVDPANPQRIFVAAARFGVYRSTNGGTSWSFSVGQTANVAALGIRLAPGDSNHVLVGASLKGVLQSSDGGDLFASTSTGISELNVFSVAANPLHPAELAIGFQGANDGGVYTSLDGGQTWTQENVPPTRWTGTRFNFDGTLYAISTGPSTVAPEGVYRRNPATGIWVGLGPDQGPLFESELAALRGSRHDPNVLIAVGGDFGVAGFEAAIWRYDGTQWTRVYESVESSEAVTGVEFVEDRTDQTMVASFRDFEDPQDGGALRSINGGLSWENHSTGFPPTAFGAGIAASPADLETFVIANRDFAAGLGGTWRTTDTGDLWTNTGFTTSVFGIAADEHDERKLYVPVFGAAPVLRSVDSGATFQPFSSGLPANISVNALSYAGGATPRLYAATTGGLHTVALNDACLADVNFDRTVDLADLAVLLAHFGTGGNLYRDGDIDGNGTVETQDLAYLLSRFGSICQ
jgi:photosystem II stability/assembly factor-like uncharacterized protein